MNLDLLRPVSEPPDFPGTPPDPHGVCTVAPSGDAGDADRERSTPRRRDWLLVALLALGLFGLGERCRVNPGLVSPSATLQSYWEALRAGDESVAMECLVNGPSDLPVPGMLWFLPPASELWLDDFRSIPVESGRVVATYQVFFVPEGSDRVESFYTGSELVRTRGQWRIERPPGEASSLPEWRPIRRAVDA